jgi:predicted nucleotidyltransferase
MLIKAKYKQMLIDIFSQIDTPIIIWAYGSRVNGDAHDTSDLDLAAFSPDGTELPRGLIASLREKIRDSNVPFLVDLFELNRLPESFRKNIEARHEEFYKSKEDNSIILIKM